MGSTTEVVTMMAFPGDFRVALMTFSFPDWIANLISALWCDVKAPLTEPPLIIVARRLSSTTAITGSRQLSLSAEVWHGIWYLDKTESFSTFEKQKQGFPATAEQPRRNETSIMTHM